MEKLKDILDNIKDRLTNPLIFSFLCSWLIINWQITVALFWLNQGDFHRLGFKSMIGFINSRIQSCYILWYPLLGAVLYTVFFPIIKHAIRLLYSLITREGDALNFKITKGSKIAIEKYLNLRSEYIKRTSHLEEVISSESSGFQELENLRTEQLTTKATLNETIRKLTEKEMFISQSMDIRLLNGYWENSFDDGRGLKGTEHIFIENGNYFIIDSLGNKNHIFNIKYYMFDNRNNRLYFVKELTDKEKQTRPKDQYFSVNDLTVQNENLISGRENSETIIAYTRIRTEST
jgi:hypothetical protein